MRTQEAEFLRAYLLPQVRSEQVVTRRVLAAIPAGRGEYRPDKTSRTATQLAWHLAGTEMWFLDAIIQRVFREDEWTPEPTATGEEIATWYEAEGERRLAGIEALSGDDLIAPVNWLGLRNDPAVTYLSLAIRHTVHHRGQLSAYVRAMGGRVPAIYVESADEPFSAGPEEIAAGTVERPPAF